jgi:hypothetical protein
MLGGMRRARLVLGVIAGAGALGGGVGCGPDLPERYWRSEHVRYFSRDSDTSVCPAILDEIEEHGAVIAGALLIERPVVTYYKFDGEEDFDAHAECGAIAEACAFNATARSTLDFDRHELVHAYLSPYGRPPWLLVEGAAVALSCKRYPRPTGSWRDAYAAPHPSIEQYAGGGWLVGYLLRMFPGRLLPRLYKQAPSNASADQFARIFEDIYEMKLDDVWAAAISVPQVPMWCPWECERPAFAVDGLPRTLEPVCGTGSLQLSVDLPASGVTRWRIEGDGRVYLRSCDGNEEPTGAISGAGDVGLMVAPLLSGRYFLDAVVGTGGTPALSGSVDTNGEAASFSCASAPALPDDLATLSRLSIFYPSSQASQFTGFATAAGRLGQMIVQSADDADAPAALCNSCGSPTCSSVSGYEVAGGARIGPGWVVDVPPGAPRTAHFSWPPP